MGILDSPLSRILTACTRRANSSIAVTCLGRPAGLMNRRRIAVGASIASTFHSSLTFGFIQRSFFSTEVLVKAGDTHPVIPRDRVAVAFSRSSGAGGQNVNKVNTKAEVRFHLATATWMEEEVRQRFAEMYAAHINAEGEVYMTSQKYRGQEANLEDCYEKLGHMVRKAAVVPKIRKMRTGLSELAKSERRDDKRHRSGVKERRKGSIDFD